MDLVGFSKCLGADGNPYLAIIGIGPRDWLEHRQHAGSIELVTRDVLPGDLVETPVEWFARSAEAA